MTNNKEKILYFTKKHPSWGKLFCSWLEKKPTLNIKSLEYSFSIFAKYKHSLKNHVCFDIVKKFDPYDSFDIVEKFYDLVRKSLFKVQSDAFINSLKTQKYKHLFNDNIEREIYIILENGISIISLKEHFFKKIARINSSEELLKNLIQFKNKNIHWSKEYYLDRIRDKKLKVNINENKNSLMIEILNYKACKELGPQSWCIVEDKDYFKYYKNKYNRQYIYFNFDLPISNNNSIIGFTVNCFGKITESFLKNNNTTPKKIRKKFKFLEENHQIILNYLHNSNNPIEKIIKNKAVEYIDAFFYTIPFQKQSFFYSFQKISPKNKTFDNLFFIKFFNFYLKQTLPSYKKKYILLNILQIVFLGCLPNFILYIFKIPNYSLIFYFFDIFIPKLFKYKNSELLNFLLPYSKLLDINKRTCEIFCNDNDFFNYYVKKGFFD